MPTEGRCNCKSITVTVDQLPPHCAFCYCSNCRRSGSSPGSIVYMLDTSAVTINDPQGLIKTYADTDTRAGTTVNRSFCSNCGSPLYSKIGDNPPQIIMKGGLFDNIPAPIFENFPEERPAWMSVAKAGQ